MQNILFAIVLFLTCTNVQSIHVASSTTSSSSSSSSTTITTSTTSDEEEHRTKTTRALALPYQSLSINICVKTTTFNNDTQQDEEFPVPNTNINCFWNSTVVKASGKTGSKDGCATINYKGNDIYLNCEISGDCIINKNKIIHRPILSSRFDFSVVHVVQKEQTSSTTTNNNNNNTTCLFTSPPSPSPTITITSSPTTESYRRRKNSVDDDPLPIILGLIAFFVALMGFVAWLVNNDNDSTGQGMKHSCTGCCTLDCCCLCPFD